MATASATHHFALGQRLYLLVSSYNNYVSISIRECFVYGSRILPTKKGINLMLLQFTELRDAASTITSGLECDYGHVDIDLGYNVRVTLVSGFLATSEKKLYIENQKTSKGVELTSDQFRAILYKKDEIDQAIESVFIDNPRKVTPPITVTPPDNESKLYEADYIRICIIILQKLIKVNMKGSTSKFSVNDTCAQEDINEDLLVNIKKTTLSKQAIVAHLPKIVTVICDYIKPIRCFYVRYVSLFKNDNMTKMLNHIPFMEEKFLKTEKGRKIIQDNFMKHIDV